MVAHFQTLLPMIKRLDFSNIEYQLSRAKEHLADIEAEISDIVESDHDIRTDMARFEMANGQCSAGEIDSSRAPRSIKVKIGEFRSILRSTLNFMTVLLANSIPALRQSTTLSNFRLMTFQIC